MVIRDGVAVGRCSGFAGRVLSSVHVRQAELTGGVVGDCELMGGARKRAMRRSGSGVWMEDRRVRRSRAVQVSCTVPARGIPPGLAWVANPAEPTPPPAVPVTSMWPARGREALL